MPNRLKAYILPECVLPQIEVFQIWTSEVLAWAVGSWRGVDGRPRGLRGQGAWNGRTTHPCEINLPQMGNYEKGVPKQTKI